LKKKCLLLLLLVTAIILSLATSAPGGAGLEVYVPEEPFVVLEGSEDWRDVVELDRQLELKAGLPDNIRREIKSKIEDIKHKVTAINARGAQFRMLGLGLKNEMLALDALYTELDSKYTALLKESPPESEQELEEIQSRYQAEMLDLAQTRMQLGRRVAEHNERLSSGPLKEVDLLFQDQVKPLLARMRRAAEKPWWKVKIGAAGGVSGDVFCEDPDGERRRMSSGKTIYHMSKCISGPDGRMQVMLLDRTVFTIGPHSEIVMDEFIYDPSTRVGTITATVTEGVLRFVTGTIARKKPESMKIKIPPGIVGIRGTDGIIRVRSGEVALDRDPAQVTILRGEVQIVTDDTKQAVTVKRGEQVTIGSGGAIEPVKKITPSEADRQWRAETGITWPAPDQDDESWSIRIDGSFIKRLGQMVVGFVPWFLFGILIIRVNYSFLDFRDIRGDEKFFWLVLGIATYMSIGAARNPDATYWQNTKSTMLAGGIVLLIIFTVPTITLDLMRRMTDFFNSAMRRFPGAWFAKVLAVVTFGFGIFVTISCGSDWIKYMWYFVIRYRSRTPNLAWRAETPAMYFAAAVGALSALNSIWLFFPPRKDYFRKKARRNVTVRHRSTKGLYGTLIGSVLGAAGSLFFPLESIWMPIIGWIAGELLPSKSDSIRRSWATLVGVIAGTFAMILLVIPGPPIMVLMLLPALFVLVAYNLERSLDKRKAAVVVETPEPEEETTWDDAAAEPEPAGAVVCPICGNNVGKRNRVQCLVCEEIVHRRKCSFEEGADAHICANCHTDIGEQTDEPGTDESQEQLDALSDEQGEVEMSISLGPADEILSVRLNRLFAACRSMRGSNPAGYSNARRQLDIINEDLVASPARRRMIETRVSQLSGGTFHWEP